MARACHALPLYTLWAATPEKAIAAVLGWQPIRQAACGHLTTFLDTQCRTTPLVVPRYNLNRFPT
jgi:hypothetical protein